MIKFIAKKSFFSILAILAVFTICQPAFAASYKFSPATLSIPYNCEQTLTLMIDTEGKYSNAAEIEITYNPILVQVMSVEAGSAFSSYIENTIDSTIGRIHLTAASFSNPLKGQKEFAIIHYKALNYTSGNISFDITFTGIGKTLDSNIAEDGTSKDILSSIQNAVITTQNSSDCKIDKTAPTINEIEKSNKIVKIELIDQESGIDINSLKIHGTNKIYNFTDFTSTLSGNTNDYYVEITLPDDLNSDSIQIVISDNAKNTATKTITLTDKTNCSSSTDNATSSRCEIIKEILSPTLNTILTTVNTPFLFGLGIFSLISALIDIMAGTSIFRNIFLGGLFRRNMRGKLVAILINATNKKPINGNTVKFFDENKSNIYSISSNKFGYVFYNDKKFIGSIELAPPYSHTIELDTTLNVAPPVYLITKKNELSGPMGIFRKLFEFLISMDEWLVLALILLSVLFGILGFLTAPSTGALIIPVIGVFLGLIGLVLAIF